MKDKKWNEHDIVALLKRNDRAVERAMIALFRRQTMTEQQAEHTFNRNNVGFSSADARKGTYYAKWALGTVTRDRRPGRLTGRHLERARRMAIKYRRQLADEANMRV